MEHFSSLLFKRTQFTCNDIVSISCRADHLEKWYTAFWLIIAKHEKKNNCTECTRKVMPVVNKLISNCTFIFLCARRRIFVILTVCLLVCIEFAAIPGGNHNLSAINPTLCLTRLQLIMEIRLRCVWKSKNLVIFLPARKVIVLKVFQMVLGVGKV